MRGEGTPAVVSRSTAAFRARRSCTSLFHHSFQIMGGLATHDIIVEDKSGFQMTVEQKVLEKLRELPLQKQEEVLAYISRLQEKTSQQTRRSLAGLWADLDVNVSEKDISQARREMWGNFPRDVS